MISVGKYPDLSNADYHGDTDSISRSAIMDYAKSPRTYWANYLNLGRPVKETTDAMEFGEQFHCMILEPEKFESDYCPSPIFHELPKVGLLKDLGREEYDRQKNARAGIETLNEKIHVESGYKNRNKKIISLNNYQKLNEMKNALQENLEAWKLISDAVYECSYFFSDPLTGLIVKARPDILQDSFVVDLKTCKDASPRGFQNAMCAGGYHIQAAMILDAISTVDNRDITTFINIAIEKEYPYSIGIYIIDEAAISAGREKYRRVLFDLKKSREENVWNDFETQIVSLPAWAI